MSMFPEHIPEPADVYKPPEADEVRSRSRPIPARDRRDPLLYFIVGGHAAAAAALGLFAMFAIASLRYGRGGSEAAVAVVLAYLSLAVGQAALIGSWLAWGHWRFAPRLVSTLLFAGGGVGMLAIATSPGWLEDLRYDYDDHFLEAAFVFFVLPPIAFIGVTWLPMYLLRLLGLTFAPAKAPPAENEGEALPPTTARFESPAASDRQFNLAHLLIFTTALAVLLGALMQFPRPFFFFEYLMGLGIVSLIMLVGMLINLSAAGLPRTSEMSYAVPPIAWGVVFFGVMTFIGMMDSSMFRASEAVFYIGGSITIVILSFSLPLCITVWILRGQGYRVARQRMAPPGAAYAPAATSASREPRDDGDPFAEVFGVEQPPSEEPPAEEAAERPSTSNEASPDTTP